MSQVPEPRSTRFWYLGIYVLWAVAGVSVLLQPPTTISGVIGGALTFTWGGFLALGATGGALTVLTRYWWLERASIWLAGTGITVYAILVGSLHLIQDGNRIPQLMFVLTGLIALIIRYRRIRGSVIQPGK